MRPTHEAPSQDMLQGAKRAHCSPEIHNEVGATQPSSPDALSWPTVASQANVLGNSPHALPQSSGSLYVRTRNYVSIDSMSQIGTAAPQGPQANFKWTTIPNDEYDLPSHSRKVAEDDLQGILSSDIFRQAARAGFDLRDVIASEVMDGLFEDEGRDRPKKKQKTRKPKKAEEDNGTLLEFGQLFSRQQKIFNQMKKVRSAPPF
jgi:hypothetical protein